MHVDVPAAARSDDPFVDVCYRLREVVVRLSRYPRRGGTPSPRVTEVERARSGHRGVQARRSVSLIRYPYRLAVRLRFVGLL